MARDCVSDAQLQSLRIASRYIYELANLVPNKHQPYVGNSAFAHKGGVHVSAIQRHAETYEHIRPEKVGNVTRVLVSDLSGRSNILAKAEQFNINLDSKDPAQIRTGNERVIRPRLADAAFFWDSDRKKTLAARAETLRDVVYQRGLGSVFDRSQRIARIAGWLAGELVIPGSCRRAGVNRSDAAPLQHGRISVEAG